MSTGTGRRFGRRSACTQVVDVRGGCTRSTKLLIRRLRATGSRACGPWPPPSIVTSCPPVSSASSTLWLWGRMASSSPWMTRTGHRTRAHAARNDVGVAGPQTPLRVGERVGLDLEPPSDAVLDLLRRVRLGEHAIEEELEEVLVVLVPVVAVVLRPAFGRRQPFLERVLRRARHGPARAALPRRSSRRRSHARDDRPRPGWPRARRPTDPPTRRARCSLASSTAIVSATNCSGV